MNYKRGWDFKLALSVVWMIFTVALAVWLLIFQSRLFGSLEQIEIPQARQILQHHKMVFYEMTTMIFALIVGGVALFYLIFSERTYSEQIRQFFAVFSHELRTSLTRIRLQADGLLVDFKSSPKSSQMLRLLDDIAKLEVQLENSLWIARSDDDQCFFEHLIFSKTLSEIASQFSIQIHLAKDFSLFADRRALESLLKNIFQNAILHGRAENIWITTEAINDSLLAITIKDDGQGFAGDPQKLGHFFQKHASTSGSGLGLFLVRKLVRLQNGNVSFANASPGFLIKLELPGKLLHGDLK